MNENRYKPRSEFAVMCGVSRAAISKATTKGKLQDAFDGTNIDLAHPEARAYYLAKTGDELPDKRSYAQHTRGVKAGKESRMRGHAPIPPSEQTVPGIEAAEQIDQFLDMSLRDIIDKFGTATRFIDWLKAVKEIENIREKRLKNDERESKMVPRPLMDLVVGAFERCFSLQLNDASKTIAARLYSYAKAGRTVEDATQLVEDQIGAPIKDAKRKIGQAIEDLEAEHNGR